MTENKNSLLLVVQINGSAVLEYNREKELSSAQLESLNLMEKKLSQGIELGNTKISSPSLEQKIEFVTANLISAVLTDKEMLAAASCAYLANTLPDLKQIKAIENDDEVSIELIFDREYQAEEKLNFTPIEKITSGPH